MPESPTPLPPSAAALLRVFGDADALSRDAAQRFADTAHAAIAARGRFTVALAGGSTPEKTYKLLAEPEFAQQIDWKSVWIFFGDERFVSADDTRSNFALAARTLLTAVPIPSDHILAVDTTLPTPDDAASAYDATLRANFAGDMDGDGIPVFDLILLGLGDDGHTASLFPNAPALTRDDVLAVASPPGTLPPPVDRITLTFPVLNAARSVVFLIAGANKADALADIREGNPAIADRPAAGVEPELGTLTYLTDEAAAAKLTQK